MTLRFPSRAKQTSTTTGTGTLDLIAPSTPFVSLVSGAATGNTILYCIADAANYEIGIGTVTSGSPDTLSRDTVLASSNAGAKVNWAAGTRDVFAVALPGRRGTVSFSGTSQTLDAKDCGNLHRFTGASACTLAAPAVATLGDGFSFHLLNDGSAAVTFDPNSSETINGAATLAVPPGMGATFILTGGAWRAVEIEGGALAAFTLAGIVSPSSIGANQNDYSPTGLSGAAVLRLTSSAAYNLTGLAGGWAGRVMLVHNIGSFALTLKDEDAASTAANRYALDGDIAVGPDQSVQLQYDATSSRWRLVGTRPSGALQLISRQTVSGVAQVDFTGFNPALYRDYRIVIERATPATDAVDIYGRTSTDGGSTFDAGGTDYAYAVSTFAGGAGTGGNFSTGDGQLNMTADTNIGNASNEDVSGIIDIINPGAAAHCIVLWKLFGARDDGNPWRADGGGRRKAAADVDGFRLIMSSGNLSGTFSFYGVRI